MVAKSQKIASVAAVTLLSVSALAPGAQAEDFFSALFNGLSGGRSRALCLDAVCRRNPRRAAS
jgi:hypothetical protein